MLSKSAAFGDSVMWQQRRVAAAESVYTQVCTQRVSELPFKFGLRASTRTMCFRGWAAAAVGWGVWREMRWAGIRTAGDRRSCCSRGGAEENQVGHNLLGDVEVNDPVHEVEAGEAHREEDAAVLVNVRGRDAAHLLQVLLAVEQRRCRLQQQLLRRPGRVGAAAAAMVVGRQ